MMSVWMKTLVGPTTVLLHLLICHRAVCQSEGNLTTNVLKFLQIAQNVEHADTETNAKDDAHTGSEEQPQVQTTSGYIYGEKNQYASSFFSIPFAVPPINHLRFKPAVKLNTPDVRRNLSRRVAIECTQPASFNEDCLVLSVHVPAFVDLSHKKSKATAILPVLLFIHGGAFFYGAGTKPAYDGRYLSHATATIIVTINYRLGPLGFLVFNDGTNVIEGNQGLGDQRLAMRWVNENIQNFGGDKNKVTLFGESAGAQSVMFHLLSKTSEPLYRNAIMESNPVAYWYPTRSQALEITKKVVEELRCDLLVTEDCCQLWKGDYACLMDVTPMSLILVMERMMISNADRIHVLSTVEPFRPFIDGYEFTGQPLTLFMKGKWNNKKSLIIGTNKQELVIFPYFLLGDKNEYKDLNGLIFKGLGKSANTGDLISEKYIQLYGSSISSYSHIFGMQMTDVIFGCTTRALARFASYKSEGDVYYYIFDHSLKGSGCKEHFPLGDMCGHSFHSAEVYFVFRTKSAIGITTNFADTLVENQFSTYWGNMAWTGNPSDGADLRHKGYFPEWTRYSKEPKDKAWTNLRIFSPLAYLEKNYLGDVCDFWDTLGLYPAPEHGLS